MSIDFCDTDFDDDTEFVELNPDVERELVSFATGFLGELKFIAKKYISGFFEREAFHQGGKIPNSLLLKDAHVSMVINYDIVKGVNSAYHYLAAHDLPPNSANDVAEDIKLVLAILDKLAEAGIPQQFAGGMVLLYLKLVEGVEIG